MRTSKWPLLFAWVLLIALDLMAALGVARIEFSHGLNRVFSGGGSRFDDYATFLDDHGSIEGVLIFVEAEDLAEPAATAVLIDLILELQFLPEVEAVVSPFSIPVPFPDIGIQTLDAATVDPPEDWHRAHELQPELARVLAEDRQSTLITVIGEGDTGELSDLQVLIDDKLAPSELSYRVTGLPIVLERSSTQLLADFLRLNVIGAALGVFVIIVALRGWWISVMTLLSSGTAVLWGIGALGWLGAEINVISIALPILVLVLSLSDAVHLGLEQGRQLKTDTSWPIGRALRRISPAVLLTSLTTALAFLMLGLSRSEVIVEMGVSGAVAVLSSSVGVLLASGVLGATALRLLGRERLSAAFSSPRRWTDWSWLSHIGMGADRAVATVGLVLTCIACVTYFLAETRFSLHENLRDDDPAMLALKEIEAEFGPTTALQIAIPLNGGNPIEIAGRVTDLVREAMPELEPVSIVALADLAETSGVGLEELLNPLTDRLRNRLDGVETGQTVVSVPFPYENSRQARALVERVEAALAPLGDASNTGSVQVTGAEVMSAYVSRDMIRALSYSLLFSIGAVGIIIALWLRSARAGVLALLANLLPVSLVGAGLALTGVGISFAGGIALTLAFGIAVDDTIHVMNRFRLSVDVMPNRLQNAMHEVTIPVVVTSLVLVAGLCGTIGANLPTVEEFGILSITVFALALLSDLLFLPALLKWYLP